MDATSELVIGQSQTALGGGRLAARCAAWLRGSAGQTFLALADQAVVSGTNFLTTVAVGRLCLAGDLGLYSLGFTVVVLALSLQQALVGAPYTVYAQRLHGREHAEYTGSVLVHVGLLSGLGTAGLVGLSALCAWLGGSQLEPLFGVLALTVPCLLLRDFARRWAFARLWLGAVLTLDLALAALQFGGLAVLAAGGRLSALGAHGVSGLACLLAGGAWLALNRHGLALRRGQVGRELRRSWAFGKWICVGMAVGVLHSYVMHWLLLGVLGVAVTGTFAACATLADLSNPLVMGLANLAGPRTARAFTDAGAAGVRRVVWQMSLLLGAPMLAFCFLLALVGAPAASWLFHGDYSRHGPTLTLLGVAALAGGLGMVVNTGLCALERSNLTFYTCVAGLLVTLAVAGCLVLPLGMLGAAWGLAAGSLASLALKHAAFARLTGSVRAEVREKP
jgi:O-antigen/teichoic acid export membrane protein